MIEEKLHTMGEVSKITGAPVKTIRYYSDIGLVPPAGVSRYRLYGAEEIWRLELVRTLRHLGFGPGDVRKIVSGDVSVEKAIGWQLEALEIRELGRMRAVLEHARASAGDSERSLDFLHGIGESLPVGAAGRSRFLMES